VPQCYVIRILPVLLNYNAAVRHCGNMKGLNYRRAVIEQFGSTRSVTVQSDSLLARIIFFYEV
jgi:hypothetical protein